MSELSIEIRRKQMEPVVCPDCGQTFQRAYVMSDSSRCFPCDQKARPDAWAEEVDADEFGTMVEEVLDGND